MNFFLGSVLIFGFVALASVGVTADDEKLPLYIGLVKSYDVNSRLGLITPKSKFQSVFGLKDLPFTREFNLISKEKAILGKLVFFNAERLVGTDNLYKAINVQLYDALAAE